MTRKDYVVIAKAIKSAEIDNKQLEAVIKCMCSALSRDNPAFNSEKFRRYIMEGK